MTMRFTKIEESFKKPGYVWIETENKEVKDGLRRLYTHKDGSKIFYITGESFKVEKIAGTNQYKVIETKVVEVREKNIPAPLKEVPEVVIPEVIFEDGLVRHEKYEQIMTCIKNDIPVFLVGPAGSGKNHTLEQIAKDLELDFYFTNSIQQEYKITGFIDAGGNYHETEFYKAFKNGGLFFLDEMDASIPEVLVLLNAAIANKYFEFPTGRIQAHDNFRVVAAGNTVGSGADENYTGRLVLDQATLDRFAIIHFDYSERIELHLAKGNRQLVEFIRELRKQAKDKGIRATFSYRCITMVTKLEGKLELTEILAIAIFKGMDKDTVNTFQPNLMNNKYSTVLRTLVRG